MTNEEWRSKSDDWHKGWRYGQGDTEIIPDLNSQDFCDGYLYALRNPFGPVSVPQNAKVKPIDYEYCSNATLKMWMEDILTDSEYNKIQNKLNKAYKEGKL